MKRRFFSILTALALCLTLLPTAALAETTPDWTGWTELTESYLSTNSNTIDGSTTQVKVYLKDDDLTISDRIKVKGNVTLDLNGHTLTGPSSKVAICVGWNAGSDSYEGHLTLKDSGTNGKVTSGDNSGTINAGNGSLTLEGGTVSCTSSPDYAIGVCENATVTLKGGTVSATDNSKAIQLDYSDHSKAAPKLFADGGMVDGLVVNRGGTITRSDDVTTSTTFQKGTVKNGGTIEWGTFNCAVENGYQEGPSECKGTITGGTFKSTVTNNLRSVIGEASGDYDRNSKISFPSGNYSNTLTNYGTIYFGTFQQGGDGDPHTINRSGGKIHGGLFSKLVNEAGGTIQPNGSVEFNPGSLINSGTVTLNIPQTGSFPPYVEIGALTNEADGTVDISTNTDLGSGSNAGTITVANGKILTLKGSMTNSGSITNHGTITNSSGTFTNSGSLTNDGHFRIKGDVLNSGTFTNYSETDSSITGGSVTCSNPDCAFRNDTTGTFNISQLSSGTAYGSFSGTLANRGTFIHTKNTAAAAGQVPGLKLVTNTFTSDSTADSTADSDMDFDLYRTVSFDPERTASGTVSYVPATQFVLVGEKAVEPSPAPTSADGKTMLFWFESGDDHDGSPFDFSTALTGPVSLGARWGDAPSELPYTTTVRQGGSATPPAMDFELEFFDAMSLSLPTFSSGHYFIGGYKTSTAAGQTSVTENLKITIFGSQSGQQPEEVPPAAAYSLNSRMPEFSVEASFENGVFVRQTLTGADTTGWSSGGEVYFIALEDGVLAVYPTTESSEMNPDGTKKVTQYRPDESPLEENETMTFTNTYTAGSTGGGGGGSGATYHTIKASAGTGGSIAPSGSVSVRRNDDRTFTVTPDTGYSISSVLVDGKSVGAVSSYTFKSVRANHTIEARFTSASAPALPIIPADLNSTDHTAYVQGFADGLVRPNAPITRAQTAVMLYRLLTPERRAEIETDVHPFTDMTAQDWYCHEVATMVNGGYISGFSDGTFRGNEPITRAQFVTILTRFIGQLDAECDFTDVPATHWAYRAIATATTAGWISGFADGSFRPEQTITRAQVMTIINRALNRGVDAESVLPAGYQNYPDNPAAAWHYYDVIEATNGHDYTGQRPSEDWTALH